MSLFSPLSISQVASAATQALQSPNSDPNQLGSAGLQPSGPSFSQTLQNAFSSVNNLQIHAGEQARAFATGQTSDIHTVMIAGEKATIALQLTAQVRNKVVEAYQEIMKITM